MAEYNSNRPQREKNMLDDRRLGMSSPTPNVKGKWASLNWGYFGNQARLTVWTNDPEDQTEKNNNGRIDVKIPATDFCRFLVLLQTVVDLPSESEEKYYMEIKDYSWFGAKRSDEIEVQGTIFVGKKDGIVWMSLVSKNRDRPRIQFKFGNTMYNVLYKGDGNPLSDAEVSVIAAKANILLLQQAVPHLAVTTYKEPIKKDNQQSGGNKGGNWNKGGGGGYSKREESSADAGMDDIPF